MANYREISITGSEHVRCFRVTIDNPLCGVPMIRFDEELATVLSSGTTTQPTGEALVIPFDPATPIAVLDPTTGAATGDTSTYGAVYQLLYSAYMAAAVARDGNG